MIPRRVKRVLWILLLVICTSASVWAHLRYRNDWSGMAYLSGWALGIAMLLLTFYNARKKLPFARFLLSSQAWLNFHVYLGLFAGVLFLLHINYRVPTGWFEWSLAALYLAVTLTGIIGLFLSRIMPKRLTMKGEEIFFDEVPGMQHLLNLEVQQIAVESMAETKSRQVADFYKTDLRSFFEGKHNFWHHVIGNPAPVSRVIQRISDKARYSNAAEQVVLEKLKGYAQRKDNLDYHWSLQLVLKSWLFFHIPLTYVLLLFMVVHIVLVFAFSGGAR